MHLRDKDAMSLVLYGDVGTEIVRLFSLLTFGGQCAKPVQ